MAQGVRGDVALRETQLAQLDHRSEGLLDRQNGFAIVLYKMLHGDPETVPTPHVRQQARGDRSWRLKLVGLLFPDRLAVVDAAFEIDEGLSKGALLRGRCNRTGPSGLGFGRARRSLAQRSFAPVGDYGNAGSRTRQGR